VALDVDAETVTGTWWRHLPFTGDPWYRPQHPADGRWQRGEVVEALYLADSPDTVWAEWYRLLAELGLRPNLQLPRDLWRWTVDLDDVADLRTAERLDRVGLGTLSPGRRDWPRCQVVGEALAAEHYFGLVAPSAARPEKGRVLCVFRADDRIQGLEPIPPPETVEEPPIPPRGMRT
jgi:RES domain-containing protein